VAFKKLNGHCNVSGRDGVLGKWCANTRHSYKAGLLSPEKTAQLDAIGFCRGLRNDRWETMYAELVVYKKDNGHCNVPHGNNPTPSGSWVAAQRQKRRNNKLSQERIAQLDALGFCWQIRSAESYGN
jgi:hypothetical protein